MGGAARAGGAYLRTLAAARLLRDRPALERWQARQVRRWLHGPALDLPAFDGVRDAARREGLDALPVIDKAALLEGFAGCNRLGLSAAEALALADAGHAPPGYAVGASTGTSGTRAPYVVSEAERFRWLGTILAKALPDAPVRRHRVAVALPRGSALYDAAGAPALRLLFLPTGDGLPALRDRLEAFGPTVLVAPPHVLRWLAERGARIAPERVFSAAEVLDPFDRALVAPAFPRAQLGEIYMATEGLFGVTCRKGTLHLAEDRVHFELEPAGPGLVSPIVTDFSRTAQAMARYRMNDLLRLGGPCPCGSPLRAVAAVEGRCDDAFVLPSPAGAAMVTPDALRDAVVSAVPGLTDFRLVQDGPDRATLTLPPDLARFGSRAAAAVERAAIRAGGSLRVAADSRPLPPPSVKLRRVERRWRPDRP